jgi:N4-bis(aminopropyl)spermidine synthase
MATQLSVPLRSTQGGLSTTRFKDALAVPIHPLERRAARLIERVRPQSLRSFDQIPMRADDLIRQAKLIGPYLADQTVVFMGDADCTSLMLGLLGKLGHEMPAKMQVVDFDERLLVRMRFVAMQHGFADRLETHLYNTFDPVPADLLGRFDWYYTNPPYGSHNNGASARLFIARGCEMTRTGGRGCIILPDDVTRPWSHHAMTATQRFLMDYGWMVKEKMDDMHAYHLDDDKSLLSSVMVVNHNPPMGSPIEQVSYAGRRVAFEEIPGFYGRNVTPPYPRYVRLKGEDYDWS